MSVLIFYRALNSALTRVHGGRYWGSAVCQVVLVGFVYGARPRALSAQEPVSGRVEGTVLTRNGEAVGDATIEVANTFLLTRSDPRGHFLLRVPSGRSTLRVRQLGYQPAERIVDVPSSRDRIQDLVIRLERSPTDLAGLVVRGEQSAPFISTMTSETVRHAPALGEADVLRMLPMLAGVSQPNDLLGRLHLAGSASDEASVLLDGHPMQSPFHLHSVFGAFNVAALDRADLSIHHEPSSFDGRLGGTVDLRTRHPSSGRAREGTLSVLATSLTISEPGLPGGGDLLASGRITYLDKLLRRYSHGAGGSGDDLMLPSFRDGLGKLEHAWSSGWSTEVIAYGSEDHWTDAQDDSAETPLQWGEYLIGVRAAYRGTRWSVTARASTDRAFAAFRSASSDPPGPIPLGGMSGAQPNFIDLGQRWTSGAVEVGRTGQHWRANGGATFDQRQNSQRWSGPRAVNLFKSLVPADFDGSARQSTTGLFAEAAVASGSIWTATAGAHVSINDGELYPAPRLLLQARLSPSTELLFAADRRHQFDAIAGEPREGSITQPVFLFSRPRVADMAAVSAVWTSHEAPRGRLRTEITAFGRRFRDRLVPDLGAASSTSMNADDDSPPGMRRVPGHAFGGSLTADLALPRGPTLQASYTLQSSREVVDGVNRPTAWDSPQQLDVFVGIPVTSHWSVTSTFQSHSGAAVTPVAARVFVPLGAGRYGQRFIYGAPQSARLPTYVRTDLGARRSWTGWGAAWSLSLQVVNVFARTNVLDYDWRQYFACNGNPLCSSAGESREGLPILPSVGLEVRW
jgi:hypothetical protein